MVIMKDSLWTIEDEPRTAILAHALADYPVEACGILLSPRERPWFITAAHPVRNATSGDPTARYFVDPKEFLAVYEWAEEEDLEICGFYHSHPDHPPVPSEYDERFAWEGYLYLILSIRDGLFEKFNGWTWDPVANHFKEALISSYEYERRGNNSLSLPAT